MSRLMAMSRGIRNLILEFTLRARFPAPETLADVGSQTLEEQHKSTKELSNYLIVWGTAVSYP
ncbi:hypothetical protein PMIN02_006230 [Paraphaeosphaeria minitans]